jgi:hypothetical protein
VAVTLVDWDDVARWQMINRALGLPFQHPVETYSTSEHLYTGLGVPRTARGVLPKEQQTREGLAAEEVEDLGETGKRGGHSTSQRGGQRDGRRGDSRPPRGGTKKDDRSEVGHAKKHDKAQDGDKPAGRKPRKRRRTRGGQEAKPGSES